MRPMPTPIRWPLAFDEHEAAVTGDDEVQRAAADMLAACERAEAAWMRALRGLETAMTELRKVILK